MAIMSNVTALTATGASGTFLASWIMNGFG